MDTQIWYAIYSTLVGGIYGAFRRLGEVCLCFIFSTIFFLVFQIFVFVFSPIIVLPYVICMQGQVYELYPTLTYSKIKMNDIVGPILVTFLFISQAFNCLLTAPFLIIDPPFSTALVAVIWILKYSNHCFFLISDSNFGITEVSIWFNSRCF